MSLVFPYAAAKRDWVVGFDEIDANVLGRVRPRATRAE
jgi:hypothetical protein